MKRQIIVLSLIVLNGPILASLVVLIFGLFKKNFTEKIVNAGFRTSIVGIKGEHPDHHHHGPTYHD